MKHFYAQDPDFQAIGLHNNYVNDRLFIKTDLKDPLWSHDNPFDWLFDWLILGTRWVSLITTKNGRVLNYQR